MNKAVKAIIAVVIICGAIYYMYDQLVKLHYIGGTPPPAQPRGAMPEGRPAEQPPPAAPAAPAPSTDSATTGQ